MPRGIYDRTKSKEQRAAEKAPAKKGAKAAAAPQKRKYTKRATVDASSVKSAKMSNSKVQKHESADVSFAMITEVRANLAVLAQLGDKFQDTPSLQTEISAHVELLGKLREKAFAHDEPVNTELVGEEVEETTPIAATSNGATAYQGSVPLPPPPSVPTAVPPPPIPTH